MTEQWPPPAIKRLVEDKLKEKQPEILEAEWPSPKEIDKRIRSLGRQLQKHAGVRELKDIYQVAVGSSRGGLPVFNTLIRPFNYSNPFIRFLGLSSYREGGGTEQADEFLYGQKPDRDSIEGMDVLMYDEVCDTGRTQIESRRILESLGAATITSAVIDFKPKKSKSATGFVPDFYVYTTEKWIVYPWEIYEILEKESLDEKIWLPDAAPGAN